MAFPQNTDRREKLAALHEQGLNDQQIADRLGVTRTSVHEMRNAMGLPAVNRHGVAPTPPNARARASAVERFLAACAEAKVEPAEESERAKAAGISRRLPPAPPAPAFRSSSLERC